jgi:C1A family cysteine protease
MAATKPLTSKLVRKTWPTAQVFDQKSTSQCVAYSGIAALVAAPHVNFPNITFESLYRECQLNDQWTGEAYDGTSVLALGKVLKRMGFISEYRWANNVDQLANYILTTGPALAGTRWDSNMFAPGKDGFLSLGGGVAGGHAYLLAGVDLEKKCPDGSTGAFRKLGSWGRSWADNGRAWISFKDMSELIADDGELMMFAESKLN